LLVVNHSYLGVFELVQLISVCDLDINCIFFTFNQRFLITGGHIMSDNSNGIKREILSQLLLILVLGLMPLAIVNKDNQLAYLDIVKIVMVYSVSTQKSKDNRKK
jgi:hypothetical protein